MPDEWATFAGVERRARRWPGELPNRGQGCLFERGAAGGARGGDRKCRPRPRRAAFRRECRARPRQPCSIAQTTNLSQIGSTRANPRHVDVRTGPCIPLPHLRKRLRRTPPGRRMAPLPPASAPASRRASRPPRPPCVRSPSARRARGPPSATMRRVTSSNSPRRRQGTGGGLVASSRAPPARPTAPCACPPVDVVVNR